MNIYRIYFLLSFAIASTYTMHSEQNNNNIKYEEEIREFIRNVIRNPQQNWGNPFIDPTKPKHQQSVWCDKCAGLFNIRNKASKFANIYSAQCLNPLVQVWIQASHEVAQDAANKEFFKDIAPSAIPAFVLDSKNVQALKARFAAMGIIS
jgi:hypothetical protein